MSCKQLKPNQQGGGEKGEGKSSQLPPLRVEPLERWWV